jgi:hypothetical protein
MLSLGRAWLPRCAIVRVSRRTVMDADPLYLLHPIDQILLKDIDESNFQKVISNPYTEAPRDADPISELRIHYNKRIIASVAFSVHGQNGVVSPPLWTPFLIDTGSPMTIVCEATYQQFLRFGAIKNPVSVPVSVLNFALNGCNLISSSFFRRSLINSTPQLERKRLVFF